MAAYKVEICGVNTSKLPVLKEEEKNDLFSRIKAGDIEARETYIKGNLRLVLSVIKRFSNSNENVDDLFQIGCIGLIKSIDNFNPEIGVKFSTYAVPMIIGEIRRYLRDNNSIRVSRSLRDTAYKAIHAREILSKELSREPTIEDIAEKIDLPKEDIVFALDAIQCPVSLYDPVYTDGGDTLYVMDQISDKKSKEETWVEELSLSDAMKRLNERENYIIKLRFFEGKTQMEVAEEIHISQAQVSRLEKSALKNMKNYISFHFYEILGLRKYTREMPVSALVSVVTFVWGVVGLVVSWRKNKVIFLMGLYAGGFLVLTFFIMQVFWNQGRLIVPDLPYLLLLLLSALYYFPDRKWRSAMHVVLPFVIVLVFMTETGRLSAKVKEVSKVTDKYYGLTPDWMNYIRASEWAAKELPENVVVGCRKPSISFVYGNGRQFYGVMNVPTGSAEELLKQCQDSPQEYAIIAVGELEKQLPVSLVGFLKDNTEAFYFNGQQTLLVIKGEAAPMADFKHLLETAQVKREESITLKEKDFVIYPDELLQKLKENSVDYILSASLRADPARKTNRTINTVERYMGYISQKYPEAFVKVAQVGSDDNEPAIIWKINYPQLPDRVR